MVASTASSIIMEQWCEDPIGSSYDLYIYVGLSVGANFFVFFRAYNLIMAGTVQGYKVHTRMMKALLYASLGDFFNRVPVGRIINRLTKDLRELDEVIGFKIGNLLIDFFRMVGDVAICVYGSTPIILAPLLFISYLSHRIRKFYMKSQIEVARY
jgi:ABC-type multidrug transport system fused ATPase/permease subunit